MRRRSDCPDSGHKPAAECSCYGIGHSSLIILARVQEGLRFCFFLLYTKINIRRLPQSHACSFSLRRSPLDSSSFTEEGIVGAVTAATSRFGTQVCWTVVGRCVPLKTEPTHWCWFSPSACLGQRLQQVRTAWGSEARPLLHHSGVSVRECGVSQAEPQARSALLSKNWRSRCKFRLV